MGARFRGSDGKDHLSTAPIPNSAARFSPHFSLHPCSLHSSSTFGFHASLSCFCTVGGTAS